MRSHIDLFDSTYRNFSEQVLQAIREGFAQNSKAQVLALNSNGVKIALNSTDVTNRS